MTGRISSIALDPADASGNRIFAGATGGGLWFSANAAAADPATVTFRPLIDSLAAVAGATDTAVALISIGAVSVQPGGTGVVLAGTGDPNDALDSYYGAGILRSTDGGSSWTLIRGTADMRFRFVGEGFAGFAWSSKDPQTVVAAVSRAYQSTLVNAEIPGFSAEGLFYSTDGGSTWSLAQITDPGSGDVQGPNELVAPNAATSVVWNPVRKLFVAAVRFHGYYQSADGITWTRLAAQPGSGISPAMCPTDVGIPGSLACPIFRGTLAVNPQTGDTFAWTVDINNQDQGIWQDVCASNGTACANQNITFGVRLNSNALEANTSQGAATIANGDYNLALAAVPSQQDTLLFAGANDLWKCSLAVGCSWRNATNAWTCMSAQVAPYQHVVAWPDQAWLNANAQGQLTLEQQIFIGNDSGVWRSTDAIGETGSACNVNDASHFQNLNPGLGSLAEVESLAQGPTSPYTTMAGLGVNGTAGVKSTSGPTTQWPQILSGEGGPVAIDPTAPSNWYVNAQAGVSIYRCQQQGACTAVDFGTTPVVTDADVGGDGDTMSAPAPFLVDPVDPTQLLVATCRVWRGPANGTGWSGGNAISPLLDRTSSSGSCNGDSLIRSIAAMPLVDGSEVIYVGMYGGPAQLALGGGGNLAGHLLRAHYGPGSGSMPAWKDITVNPVSNDAAPMNAYGFDISSIAVDPHDPTGNTVYVTVDAFPLPSEDVRTVYQSTDGGATWAFIASNLPQAPANSIVVDPQDANTVYIGTDVGVFSTRQISSCSGLASACWSAFGTGLPEAPVVQLSAASLTESPSVLVAGTYGRGIWQVPLWTAGTQLTTATAAPNSLTFAPQPMGTTSSAQTITVFNTGGIALSVTSIAVSGDFTRQSDTCQAAPVNAGSACTIQIAFAPSQTGSRTGQATIFGDVAGGQFTVALSGTGEVCPDPVCVSPTLLGFGQEPVGSTSAPLQVTVENTTSSAIPVSTAAATAPFVISANACGASLAPNSDCQITVAFAPTQRGAATGTLTLVDGAGTQAVALSGTGQAPATDSVSPASLTFSGTVIGQESATQAVTLTNGGDLPLTSIKVSVSGPFQVSNECGTQVAGNSSCGIAVAYLPTAAGSQTGTLTLSDLIRTQTVALAGMGILPPALGMSPARLDFSSVGVGKTSAAQAVTVTNSGAQAIGDLALSVSSGFQIGGTTCAASLAAGASCTASIVFAPASAGAATGALTASSSTAGTTTQAYLSGMGFDFTAAVSGSSSHSVSNGQTASYAIVLTPLGGASGTFSLQCGSLPGYSTCAFNPASPTAAANTSANVTVQVATGQAAQSAARPINLRGILAFCALLLAPAIFRRKRRGLLAWALVAILACTASGCTGSGGGSGSGSGGGGGGGGGTTTPAGTYSIPISATANGVTHSVTVSLTVQ